MLQVPPPSSPEPEEVDRIWPDAQAPESPFDRYPNYNAKNALLQLVGFMTFVYGLSYVMNPITEVATDRNIAPRQVYMQNAGTTIEPNQKDGVNVRLPNIEFNTTTGQFKQ